MLKRFWCHYPYRTFSKSIPWRDTEKAKSSTPATSVPTNQDALDLSMTFVPSEYDKRLLLISGKYKSREEIPPRVRFDTMNYAKSRIRIKVANILMVSIVLGCIGVIYMGKQRQKEGDTLLKRFTERENQLREEGRKRREQ